MSSSRFFLIAPWLLSAAHGLLGCAAFPDGDAPGLTPVVQGAELRHAFGETHRPIADDCWFSSPLLVETARDEVVVGAVGEHVVGLDPGHGGERWRIRLPAADGERAFVVATPARVGRRLVVAYHTTRQSSETREPGRNLNDARVRQMVAVVDVEAGRVDPEFEPLTVELSAPAHEPGRRVEFLATNALARGALVHAAVPGETLGRVYVTFGNVRDIQPWHGWIAELSLDRWRGAASSAIAATLVTTPEHDCGPAGQSGSRTRRCGGGLWSPSGPLLRVTPAGHELILAPGNGQLDLARQDYANTLMRVGPGLSFAPGCDPEACRDFDPDAPSRACVESCRDLFVPRTTPEAPSFEPETGSCAGLTLFQCWATLDYVGGSTPAELKLPSGAEVLLYPTKDGHAYLVDAAHLGTLHQRLQLVSICGAPGDPCEMDWAGMIVTQPAVGTQAGESFAVIPTFMPDHTHPAGIVGLRVVEGREGPRLERAWEYPAFSSSDAVRRFRRHPSRPVIAPLGASGELVAWTVEVGSGPGVAGRLIALRLRDGHVLVDVPLRGRGMRFTQPLFHRDVIYVPSCETDNGPSHLEAYRVSPG